MIEQGQTPVKRRPQASKLGSTLVQWRMHEWALAESVVALVEQELQKHPGATLRKINLVFGELQNIDRDIFATGLRELLTDLPRMDEAVKIDVEPARFLCNTCGREWDFEEEDELSDEEREAVHFLPEAAHAFLHCPGCGGTDYQVTAGRGVSVASIELLEAEPDGGTT